MFRLRIGEYLADARHRKGLSLRDLAVLTGISSSHLSELETGVRPNPKWRTMVKVAKALNLRMDVLARYE